MSQKFDIDKVLDPKLPSEELVLRGELFADFVSARDEGNNAAAVLALSILMARVNS